MQNKFKRVLLIDDNEIDLKINTKLINLSNLFEEIVVCHSGEEALDYLRKQIFETEIPLTFILLDIQMPEMDGFEFLIQYKLLPKQITDNFSIAMLSSTLDFGDIKRAEANPQIVKLLMKPLIVDEILKLLQ